MATFIENMGDIGGKLNRLANNFGTSIQFSVSFVIPEDAEQSAEKIFRIQIARDLTQILEFTNPAKVIEFLDEALKNERGLERGIKMQGLQQVKDRKAADDAEIARIEAELADKAGN